MLEATSAIFVLAGLTQPGFSSHHDVESSRNHHHLLLLQVRKYASVIPGLKGVITCAALGSRILLPWLSFPPPLPTLPTRRGHSRKRHDDNYGGGAGAVNTPNESERFVVCGCAVPPLLARETTLRSMMKCWGFLEPSDFFTLTSCTDMLSSLASSQDLEQRMHIHKTAIARHEHHRTSWFAPQINSISRRPRSHSNPS